MQLEMRLQSVPHGSPILRGGFHHHLTDSLRPQPCLQVQDLRSRGAELPLHVLNLLTTLHPHYYRQHLLMHVDPRNSAIYCFRCFHIDLLVIACDRGPVSMFYSHPHRFSQRRDRQDILLIVSFRGPRSNTFTASTSLVRATTSTVATDLLLFSSPSLCGTQ